MGLFDQITNALGGQDGGQGNLMQVVMQLVQNHPGGLQGLMDQFSQAGLAQHVQSWIGTGSNLPVSGADIAKVISGGQLAQIASQPGLDQSQAADSLAWAGRQVHAERPDRNRWHAGAGFRGAEESEAVTS